MAQLAAAVVPYMLLAGACLATWVWPDRYSSQAVRHLLYLMLVEFMVIHSTASLAVLTFSRETSGQRASAFTGLFALYSAIAVGVSIAWGEPWPALGFWVLTLAKYPGVALALGSATGEWVARRHWLTMVAFYVLAAAVTALVPVPRLGVTDLVVRAQGLGAGGLWAREPQRVLAFGFVYFVALGVFEGVRNAATLLGDTERGRGEWGIEPA